MSYLATQPMALGRQWLAQSINILVQLFAMAGHFLLNRALLRQKRTHELRSKV